MALVESDFVSLIEFHINPVGIFLVFFIGVAVMKEVHVIEDFHHGGVSEMKEFNGGDYCVMAEFISEGDFFSFDVKELLVFDGADGTVEGFAKEAKMGVDFGEFIDVFKEFWSGFKVDNHGLGGSSALFVGGGVVLDFLGALHVEVIEVEDCLGEVDV